MKKTLHALVALALAAPLALGACSSPAPEQPKEEAKTEATTEKKDEATTEKKDETTTEKKDETTTETQSANTDVDDIVGWGIKIASPEGTTSVMKGEEYYIYTREGEQFPYVLVTVYNMDKTGDEFLAEFTDYMKGEYDDLEVVEEPADVTIGDKSGSKMVYTYTVEGHATRDTRVAVPANGRVYMFATKEIDDLDLSVGDVFEQVIKDSVIYKAN